MRDNNVVVFPVPEGISSRQWPCKFIILLSILTELKTIILLHLELSLIRTCRHIAQGKCNRKESKQLNRPRVTYL